MVLRITITDTAVEEELYNLYLDMKRKNRGATWNEVMELLLKKRR